MVIFDVLVENIRPYDNNPRLNDGAVDAVAESIKHYGFLQPIVVDSEMVIVAGHTRYKAARELGLNTVPCLVLEDGTLTPDEIRAYRIADNKTSDLSIWDNKKLLSELDGLDDLFTGFEVSDFFGFDYDDHTKPTSLEEAKERFTELADVTSADALQGTGYYVFRVKTDSRELAEKMADYWRSLNAGELRVLGESGDEDD